MKENGAQNGHFHDMQWRESIWKLHQDTDLTMLSKICVPLAACPNTVRNKFAFARQILTGRGLEFQKAKVVTELSFPSCLDRFSGKMRPGAQNDRNFPDSIGTSRQWHTFSITIKFHQDCSSLARFDLDGFISLASILPSKFKAGITTKFNSVEVKSPPTTTIAKGCSISCPAR